MLVIGCAFSDPGFHWVVGSFGCLIEEGGRTQGLSGRADDEKQNLVQTPYVRVCEIYAQRVGMDVGAGWRSLVWRRCAYPCLTHLESSARMTARMTARNSLGKQIGKAGPSGPLPAVVDETWGDGWEILDERAAVTLAGIAGRQEESAVPR